ncbi:hypothetical protein SKAU_G00143990 [Synaphobranchus kaupii]|uniref:Uncharacterized protein n=1 Tax=Synaphobranchus kaupii TaxID=118154 RepID=A0A9Q1J4J6_SYNKA|nr:hypothetical protein SKAU_G00143990 [Synaphobranchus kaupii]
MQCRCHLSPSSQTNPSMLIYPSSLENPLDYGEDYALSSRAGRAAGASTVAEGGLPSGSLVSPRTRSVSWDRKQDSGRGGGYATGSGLTGCWHSPGVRSLQVLISRLLPVFSATPGWRGWHRWGLAPLLMGKALGLGTLTLALWAQHAIGRYLMAYRRSAISAR